MMKKIVYTLCISLSSLLALTGCNDWVEGNVKSNVRTVHASFDNDMTRVGIEQATDSRDMITKWQEDDKIHVFVSKGNNIIDLGSVPVHDISSDGKSCTFQYALPDDFDEFGEGYYLTCFTENCLPKIKDGDLYCSAALYRMPIRQFKAPLFFDTYVKEENSFGAFRHFGTYEIMHVTNNTEKDISFQLSDFNADIRWYKKGGVSLRMWDNSYVTDLSYEEKPLSPAITIPAHGTEMIVSWYIPNGQTIENAKIVANIDGEYVHSSNTISSNVTLCTGIAYHMYSTWDGKELRFGKGDINQRKVIKVEPTEIKFGEVPVGTSRTEHFTVSNVGDLDITFKVSEQHTEIDIPESGKEFTLSRGDEKKFDVIYTPTNPNGGNGASVRVYSDAENDTEIVWISGQGVEGGNVTQTETITIPGTNVSFKMVAVDGGTFWMGAADDDTDTYDSEKPRHQVTLSSFSIGQTEVTQALWEAVMGSNPSYFKGANLPAEGMSWNDSQEFITKLNQLTGRTFRLPTEAEWEYAARGGKYSHGYKYAGSNDVDAVAWYAEYAYYSVAQKQANELGLYDMSGNVWEWCQDWYDKDFYSISQVVNPCNNTVSSDRVARGGGWRNVYTVCQVTTRGFWPPNSKQGDHLCGMRLALSDDDETPQAYLSCPDDHHPHMIDLGLPSGTKWACCNVDDDHTKQSPTNYGSYYAWGETKEHEDLIYNWSTYTHCDGSWGTCHDLGSDIAGTQYDAATANWGSPWVMPSKEQTNELKDKCTSEWTTENGVNGRRFTGPNGGSIFLPAAGSRWDSDLYSAGSLGYYWSSTQDSGFAYNAYDLGFSSGGTDRYYNRRCSGRSVRPVVRN